MSAEAVGSVCLYQLRHPFSSPLGLQLILNPPAPSEEGKHGQDYRKHNAHNDLKGEWVIVGWEVYVHAEDAGDEGEGEEDDRDEGEDLDYLVDAAGGEGVAGVAQAFDDLFEVFKGVPDFAELVSKVAEVFLHVLTEDVTVLALKTGDDRDQGFDDAAK